jgi:hypothetical protein
MRELWEEFSFVWRFYPLESALNFLLGGLVFSLFVLLAVFVPLHWLR